MWEVFMNPNRRLFLLLILSDPPSPSSRCQGCPVRSLCPSSEEREALDVRILPPVEMVKQINPELFFAPRQIPSTPGADPQPDHGPAGEPASPHASAPERGHRRLLRLPQGRSPGELAQASSS